MLRRPIIAGIVVAALALLPATAAHASTGSTPSPGTTTYTRMVVKGYDAQVALAHGYQIVTNANGTQESIPITAAAIAQRAQAQQARAAAQAKTQGVAAPDVVGDCGYSWLSGTKAANNTLKFNTGFVVYGAGYEYDWYVYALAAVTVGSWSTSGPGPASGNKHWDAAMYNIIGPGIAAVPIGSASAEVILVDGTVCYSDGPSFAFG